MNSYFNSDGYSANTTELNDYYVGRLLLTILTCISMGKMKNNIVAKNAVEFEFDANSVLRLEKNKNGFTLYAKSNSLPSFNYTFEKTSVPELIFATVFNKIKVFMF